MSQARRAPKKERNFSYLSRCIFQLNFRKENETRRLNVVGWMEWDEISNIRMLFFFRFSVCSLHKLEENTTRIDKRKPDGLVEKCYWHRKEEKMGRPKVNKGTTGHSQLWLLVTSCFFLDPGTQLTSTSISVCGYQKSCLIDVCQQHFVRVTLVHKHLVAIVGLFLNCINIFADSSQSTHVFRMVTFKSCHP